MKLWVGFGSAIAATSIIRKHCELLHFFDSQLLAVRSVGKNLYIFVQCEVRHLGNTAYNMHTCDKGLNPLFYSCCELGLLHWQPVNFSDCKTAEGQEGSWAVPTAPEDQGGFASCAGCVWPSSALLEVWPWVTELKGNVATDSGSVTQTRSPLE